MRAHHGDLLPRLLGGENGLVAHPLPCLPVRARRVSDPGPAPSLPGVPDMVHVPLLENDRAVQIVLPVGLVGGTKDDQGFAPLDTIFALNQGDAFLGSPGEPHSVVVAFLQNGDVEAGSEITSQHRILWVFDPAGRCLARRLVLVIGLGHGQQKHPQQGHYQQVLHRMAPSIIPFPLDHPNLGLRGHDPGQVETCCLVQLPVFVHRQG